MSEKLNPTSITRDSWDFTTDHFSILLKIIAIPFILSVSLEGFIEIYYGGNPTPYAKAGVDGLYCVLEAMWGVRWLRYLLEPPRQNKYFMAPFRFGRHEFKYASYAFILMIPIMLDDIAIGLNLPSIVTAGLLVLIFAFLFITIRFEFIFPSIAISHATSFSMAWRKSKPYWGSLIISFVQSLVIMIPVLAVLSVIGFIAFVGVWAFGLADISAWTAHDGFDALFQRSPIILGLYLIIKEGIWFLFQALLLTIIGLYYRDASVKIASRKI